MEIIAHKHHQPLAIRSFEVDKFGKLTPSALCNYFQEIAWENAQKINYGYSFLKSLNKFWVLSRMHVKILDYPKWTETIDLVTWPTGMDGLFALRDFKIFNKDNKLMVAATSSWLILDMEKHRPQKIDAPEHPVIITDPDRALNIPAEKFSLPEQMTLSSHVTAHYTDIDINQHVNNVKYIEWALNTQTAELCEGKSIKEFTVNFLKESSLYEELSISSSALSENTSFVSIHNQTKNKDACIIKFLY